MAGAVVGGAFLSASLKVLFQKLASQGIGDFNWGRKHEEGLLVKKLTATLLSVEVILHDGVKKRIANSAVMEWLSELETTVNEAECLLGEIAGQGPKIESRSISTRIKSMREVLERLEHMKSQKDVLHLIGLSYILPTTSIPMHEPDILGRVDDKERIVSIVLSNHVANEDPVQLIGIVGAPGIGKTTLAQLVYNDHRVGEHFDFKVWICFSSRPDIHTVTKTILKAVTSANCDIDDLNLLQLRLGEQLMEKKLMLVLDDVWSTEDCMEWDVLRSPFKFCAQGSCIVVTTRIENIAGAMRTLQVHHLNPLSYEDCLDLFSRHAFSYGYSAADPRLEAIGRDIVRKCRGLPIAAKTLGVLLRKKPDHEEWDKILKDDVWDSSTDVTNILLKLKKRTLQAQKRVQESRINRATEQNMTAIGNNSVPSSRDIEYKRARLPIYCVLWIIMLGILSTSVYKIGNKFHTNKRHQQLGNMCDERVKMLQDQFKHHVINSYSLVNFLLQVHRVAHVLDDDQCGAAVSDFISGSDSMFPFLGAVTMAKLYNQDNYKPIMGCPGTEPGKPLAPLISSKMDIMNAIATGETVISRPFKHSHSHYLRFALIIPLYREALLPNCNPTEEQHSSSNKTREQRISASAGYIGILFHFDSLVEHVLGQLDGNRTISVAVHDVTNSSELLLLYGPDDYESEDSYVHKSKLELGDPFRKYETSCWYRQEVSSSWVVITVTGLTIAIGLLSGCGLLGAAIHSLRIQELEVQAGNSSAASSQLLSTASREIRVPANSILEALLLVLSTGLNSPQKDYVRVAQEGCKRLTDLIDELANTGSPNLST